MEKHIKIYVQLLDEGSVEVFRPVQAIIMGENAYKILGFDEYDSETETWEFLPGTIVSGERVKSVKGGEFLMAIAVI